MRAIPLGSSGQCGDQRNRSQLTYRHGHWKTIAFIAGLRRRATIAPLLGGPMNPTFFIAYRKQCFVPTLKRGVIRDNG
jgi:hypothetical protein